ncbi:hypothetical protein [Paraburkholderia sp. JPY419]|uniref:hypothetical protein n=1 Tax=Paraburkholderia sp. JPY419 TaxID=667660 RepID=UPI003D2417AC
MNHAQTASFVLIEDDDGHATLVERNPRRAGASPLAATHSIARSTFASRSNTIRSSRPCAGRFFLQVVKLPPAHRLEPA